MTSLPKAAITFKKEATCNATPQGTSKLAQRHNTSTTRTITTTHQYHTLYLTTSQ